MYNPTKWQDHVTEPENEYIIEQIEGDRYKITPCGDIIQKGTLLSAENFNNNEMGLSKAVIALCSLLQKALICDDKLEHLLSGIPFFFTDEYTIEQSQYESVNMYSLIVQTTVPYSKKNIRKNTDYIAVPIITNITVKTDFPVENIKYASSPIILVTDKSVDNCTVQCCRADPNSYIDTYSFKMLIIGGV